MTFTFVYKQNIFYVIVFKNANIAHTDFELFRFRLFFFFLPLHLVLVKVFPVQNQYYF